MRIFNSESSQYLVLAGLALGIILLAGIISSLDTLYFRAYFGILNPFLTVLSICILGIILLSYLLSKGWFLIYKKENKKGLLISFTLASLLGLIMMIVDTIVILPKEMNVLFPYSLLFYPVMGFVVQIIFHVLPLTILLIIFTKTVKESSYAHILWFCILVVATIEPVYQILAGFTDTYSIWVTAYIAIHIFIINLFELMIFKRYDFVSMYLFRITYYLFWHIGWGYLRLKLLF